MSNPDIPHGTSDSTADIVDAQTTPTTENQQDQEELLREDITRLRDRFLEAVGIDPKKVTVKRQPIHAFPGQYQNFADGTWSLYFNTDLIANPETRQIRLGVVDGSHFAKVVKANDSSITIEGAEATSEITSFLDKAFPPETPREEA